MKLVWTKGNSILSKAIRLITGDDCSHFAVVLYDGKPGEIMFESNLLGTHPAFFRTSLRSHQIVHEFDLVLEQPDEDAVWDKIVEIYDGRKYDFFGALYLGIRKAMNRIFGTKLPESNAWARQDRYFCSEVFEALRGIKGIPETPKSNSMHTPHDYWEYFK